MDYKKVFHNFEEILCVVLLAFMASLAFINVLSRYIFHYSIACSGELALNAFVWVTLLGASVAFKRKNHAAVHFLVVKFPKRIQQLLMIFSLILCVVLFILLIITFIEEILCEIEIGNVDLLGIPVYFYSIGVPVFSILIIIRIFGAYVETLKELEDK